MSRSSVSKNIFSVALSNLALPVAAFAAGPILAHSLGVEGRGELTAAVAPLLLFTAIGTVGLPEAANFFVARNPNLSRFIVRQTTWLLTISGVLATALAFAITPLLASGNPALHQLMLVAVLATTPTLVIGAIRGAAQGQHLWGRVNAERYVTAATRLVALLILWLSGSLTPFTGMLALIISPLLGGLAYTRLPSPRATDEPLPIKRLLGYGSRIWLGSLSGILLARIDQVLMTPLGGTYALGLYAVAVNIAEVVLITNHAVRDVMFSADAADSNDERVFLSSRLSMLTSALIGLGICATMNLWVGIIFGHEFSGSVLPTCVLVAAYVLWVPGSIAGATLSSRGLPGKRSIGLFIATLANVVCLVILVPIWGALGAAYAMLVGNIFASVYTLACVNRYFNMPILPFYAVRFSDFQMIIHKLRSVRRNNLREVEVDDEYSS
ncbi:oligosaccharide flippase family protein [Pseudarthrobacter sulfonivorans]|uniref:oligosaccharide flippase family protein n=1 Tax=Pseudarthrobacter sulfonivorans TaxID=121292 RepID=UPI00210658B9|nr:oligosaccharide flippase family protein [Pseudarthrobacter sulfonivorans]